MTIAPKEWGRTKIQSWNVVLSFLAANMFPVEIHSIKTISDVFFFFRFESTERQASKAVVLRDSEQILPYPRYFRGNVSLSEDTINSVIQFYREAGISQMSANSKDTLQINKKSVPVRFMEMTVLEVFRTFEKSFPHLVGCSTFYALQPREIKIASPHDICMCIYHENMNLLLHV